MLNWPWYRCVYCKTEKEARQIHNDDYDNIKSIHLLNSMTASECAERVEVR